MSDSSKPWESNPAWKSGEIKSSSNGIIGFWFFALLWNGISSPAVFMGIPEMYKAEKYWAILAVAIFPVVGMFLLFFCIYKTLQILKYSKSTFKMLNIPGVIGGKLTGELLLPAKLAYTEEISIRLLNINQITTGSGKNRTTRRNTLWQTSRVFTKGEWKLRNGRVVIPIDMTISYECKEHDKSNTRNCIYWHMEVYSAMPGIDFSTGFEVPVFKTEESNPDIISASQDEERVLNKQPNMKGITYQELENGIRVFVHPFKFLGTGLAMLTFSMVLGITLVILINKELIIPSIFVSGFGLLFLIMGLHYLLIQTEIVFYENYGQIKSTWLGLGFVREFDLRDIKDINEKIASQTTSDLAKDRCNFTLEFIPHKGNRLSLNEMTSSYDQIVWIKAKLKQKLSVSSENQSC